MTDEQQRIAIAEACGLFRLGPLRRMPPRGMPSTDGVRLWYCESHHGGAATYVEVPHYPNDFNAMHCAEEVLMVDVEKWLRYADQLRRVCDRLGGPACIAYHATARQRAEAFLRTLGLWKDPNDTTTIIGGNSYQ